MKVYILAGASGCGKSQMAQKIYAAHPRVVICSADDYLYDSNGVYAWSADKLPGAHNECLKKFIAAVQDEVPVVVVDNTNTTIAEMAPYYSIATAYGAEVELIILFCNAEKAARRNKHNTPVTAVSAQIERLGSQALPPFWKCSLQVICTD